MTSSTWKAWAVLAAVFLAGAMSGTAVTAVVARRTLTEVLDRPLDEAREWAIVFRMDRALGLSAEQELGVRAVLGRHRGELVAIRASIQPATREVRARQWAEVRALLGEAQRPAFDALIAEWEARVRETRERRASPPPSAADQPSSPSK